MDIIVLKKDIQEIAEITAISFLKQLNPVFDDLKRKDAYKIAGVRWLNYHIKKGNIKGVRRGTASNSPIYYSRLEIAALKKAEAINKAEFLNFKSKKNE
jgi:hypothetical protein